MTQIQDVVSSAFQLLNDHEISEDSTYLLAKKIDQLTKEELDCKIEHIGPYPFIYTEIVEDRQLQISIFYIKKGYHLPLHDHPGMYGIIKVSKYFVTFFNFNFHEIIRFYIEFNYSCSY